jgi:hypothetical protein
MQMTATLNLLADRQAATATLKKAIPNAEMTITQNCHCHLKNRAFPPIEAGQAFCISHNAGIRGNP